MAFQKRHFQMCAAFIVLLWPLRTAIGADVWLAGADPFARSPTHPAGTLDFMDLFRPDAPWATTASRVQVFKLSTQFAAKADDHALRSVIEDLDRRHIALGLEALIMRGNGPCGNGIEGYSAPNTMKLAAERIKNLGGKLRYAAMDEPLWFGHHHDGPQACKTPIKQLAQAISADVAVLRNAFPEIQIGDIEPLTPTAGPSWIDEIMAWTTEYQSATGIPLAFFHIDLDWKPNWREPLRQLVARLREAGIKPGIIYNGNVNDASDLAWTQRAEQRFLEIEAEPALRPDHAILQTWMPRPSRLLPETQPGTMTNLVLRYTATPTSIREFKRERGQITGLLMEPTGQPIAHAPISVIARNDHAMGKTTIRKLSGMVPAHAKTAIIGLRINTECGGCSAAAEISLGSIQYRDQGGMQANREVEASPPLGGGIPVPKQTLRAVPGQSILINTKPFGVSAGYAYTLEVPMRATPDAKSSVYVALIFLDSQNKEVMRARLEPEPGEGELLGTIKTDGRGRFKCRSIPNRSTRGAEIDAVFSGDDRYRSSSATIH